LGIHVEDIEFAAAIHEHPHKSECCRWSG
jgi:hypothetical protein